MKKVYYFCPSDQIGPSTVSPLTMSLSGVIINSSYFIIMRVLHTVAITWKVTGTKKKEQ